MQTLTRRGGSMVATNDRRHGGNEPGIVKGSVHSSLMGET
jgi:hypothetical protein